MVDWKRSCNVTFESFGNTLTPPLEHLEECNGWLYAMQLNMYAYILESEYDKTVAYLYIGVVHPLLDRPRLIQVPHMNIEIEAVVADQVDKGLAWCAAVPGDNSSFILPI